MLGITGDMAFAAGCLLRAVRRHSPGLAADIRIYYDGLSESDARLLAEDGAELAPYVPPAGDLHPEALKTFSPLCLARFEAFRLLGRYHSIVWLDVDTAVQDDITPLFDYGPFSLAPEDPHFGDAGGSKAGINVYPGAPPLPDLDCAAPNLNSGVMTVRRAGLPDPEALYCRLTERLRVFGPTLRYPDQALLNELAQYLEREHPGAFHPLPYERFNAHPRNPRALDAAVVHAFGAYKLWDDGLTRCAFPEWQRDYLRWLARGGSAWRGEVENAAFLEGGPFFMLRRLFEAVSRAQEAFERQGAELERERAARARLEKIVETLRPGQ
jgi:hypothetical protein